MTLTDRIAQHLYTTDALWTPVSEDDSLRRSQQVAQEITDLIGVTWKLNVELHHNDGQTTLEHLLFPTEAALDAAEAELDALFDNDAVQVYRATPVRVLPNPGTTLHQGPLADVKFVQDILQEISRA